jgi:hypothetical protein
MEEEQEEKKEEKTFVTNNFETFFNNVLGAPRS